MTTKNRPSMSREVENFPRQHWTSTHLWHLVVILLLLNLGVSSVKIISIPHQELIVNTDKARYQQSDRVCLWIVLPFPQSDILVSFEVDDPNDQPLLILSKLTNASGIAEITFSLSHNATTGIYHVYASTANETGIISFEVITIITTTTTTTEPAFTTTTLTTAEETSTITTETTSPPSRTSGFEILSILSILALSVLSISAILLYIKRLRHKT